MYVILFDSKETTFEFGSFRTISGYLLCNNLSQNLGADHHFEVLNMPKS